LLAGIHRPSLLVAQPLIVLPDPEKPATNDLFAAEQQFAPVEKSQSIVKAARRCAIHIFVYICDLSSGESLGLI